MPPLTFQYGGMKGQNANRMRQLKSQMSRTHVSSMNRTTAAFITTKMPKQEIFLRTLVKPRTVSRVEAAGETARQIQTVFDFVDKNTAKRETFGAYSSQMNISSLTPAERANEMKVREFIREESEIKLNELAVKFKKAFNHFEPKSPKRERGGRRYFSTLPIDREAAASPVVAQAIDLRPQYDVQRLSRLTEKLRNSMKHYQN